ncbi:MAG: YtxH domain-containing protein [bacterium]
MSYLGPDRSPAGTRTAPPPANHRVARVGADPSHDTDWQQVAVFGAGLALGILVGAGVALLTAPQAGVETRDDLRRGARRTTRAIGRRSRTAWTELQEELRSASESLRRRKLRRSRDRAVRRELARESDL